MENKNNEPTLAHSFNENMLLNLIDEMTKRHMIYEALNKDVNNDEYDFWDSNESNTKPQKNKKRSKK